MHFVVLIWKMFTIRVIVYHIIYLVYPIICVLQIDLSIPSFVLQIDLSIPSFHPHFERWISSRCWGFITGHMRGNRCSATRNPPDECEAALDAFPMAGDIWKEVVIAQLPFILRVHQISLQTKRIHAVLWKKRILYSYVIKQLSPIVDGKNI